VEELERHFDAQSLVWLSWNRRSTWSPVVVDLLAKGKEKEEAISLLESPIVLQDSPTSAGSSNSSYLAPPIANEPSTLSLTLVVDEDRRMRVV